ncbi:hypothetical protein [Exiguobacterium sp. HVEsp1]|uniref:hypothetical protein n=1 Tax=Exiguobacterium sp. HVEsp1 TaxID=1934003 RepID=UPI00099100CE|nr:hypothetical protein [Exiguobacterium sp. HVEsp1]
MKDKRDLIYSLKPLPVTPISSNQFLWWMKAFLLLLILGWCMTMLNVVSENSTERYMKNEYGVEEIYFMEEERFYYVIDRQFKFERFSSATEDHGYLRIEQIDYTDRYGNKVDFRFVKVAGIFFDRTDHEANYRVLERKKLSNEQSFDE